MTVVGIFDDLPASPPMLDQAAIEQARLVRLARDHLAATEPSVDYDGLAAGRQSSVLAARQWVKRQRAAHRIFVVDHGGRTLIPSFQLDEVFGLNEQTGTVVGELTTAGMGGWAIWQWFTAENPWIEGRPIDRIGTDDIDRALSGLVNG